jgi:hypothetical protein
LGEDELVSIMERPTLASDRRLARAMATEFLRRAEHGATERMRLMREASKRILRLTPFVAFGALTDAELAETVSVAFETAAGAIAGRTPTRIVEASATRAPRPNAGVTQVTSMIPQAVDGAIDPQGNESADNVIGAIAEVAVELARMTGRVTNIMLRNVAQITSDEARDVFKQLVDEGRLVRRGEKRGTHYIVPDVAPEDEGSAAEFVVLGDLQPGTTTPEATDSAPSDSALMRLLRRAR